jgi:accessory gene regulator B
VIQKIKHNKTLRYLYTLRYVKLASYISAKSLQQKLKQSHKQKYLYYYGFQFLYGAINKFALLILIGLILNILPQLLIATLSFVLLRVWIGGLHFDNYTKCAWYSLGCLTSMGLLAKYIPYDSEINLLVFLTVFVIALVYAPVEHKNRKLTNSKKIKFKYTALSLVLMVYIIQLFINDMNINNSIMYGILLSGVIAFPIFNNVE